MNRKLRHFLFGAAAAAGAAACVAVCAALFSSAYEAGARTASSGSVQTGSLVSSGRASSVQAVSPVKKETEGVRPEAERARELVLVNGDNPLPAWFKLNLTESFGQRMDEAAAEAFVSMKTDASRDGVSLWVSSAYRSGELQGELYRREIEECAKTCATYGDAEALAQRSVAPPGCSEYETGLALDLNGARGDFETSAAFRWLGLHAQDYGFILRCPKDKQDVTKVGYEPWHYRYVGVADAQAMKKAGLCLEEYAPQKTGAVH